MLQHLLSDPIEVASSADKGELQVCQNGICLRRKVYLYHEHEPIVYRYPSENLDFSVIDEYQSITPVRVHL